MKIVNKKLLKNICNELMLNSKVSQKELAIKYSVSERTIRRYYKILKESGYIVQQSAGRKTMWYVIK